VYYEIMPCYESVLLKSGCFGRSELALYLKAHINVSHISLSIKHLGINEIIFNVMPVM
jgi:hypothetical protein